MFVVRLREQKIAPCYSAQRSSIRKQAAQHDRASGGHRHASRVKGLALFTATAITIQANAQQFYRWNWPLALMNRAQATIKSIATRKYELQMKQHCCAATESNPANDFWESKSSPAFPAVGTTVGTMDHFWATKKKGLRTCSRSFILHRK